VIEVMQKLKARGAKKMEKSNPLS